jgi:hypothetical protein
MLSLVIASAVLVHATAAGSAASRQRTVEARTKAAPGVVQRVAPADLPPLVRDMRDMILAAVTSGHIEDLVGAVEWNEIRPDFGEPHADVTWSEHLKSLSADGQGRDILDLLGRLLALPAARLPIGRDVENSALYVWPYLAELPLDNLTPAERADLEQLVPAAEREAMETRKKWTWWRLAIGADGTWHVFSKSN